MAEQGHEIPASMYREFLGKMPIIGSLVSIQLVAPVSHGLGWLAAFTMLAVGPVLVCVAMARLRTTPETALRLAGGSAG